MHRRPARAHANVQSIDASFRPMACVREGQSAHRYTPEERAALEEQKKKNIEAAQSKRKIYLRVPYKEKKTAIGFGAFFGAVAGRFSAGAPCAASFARKAARSP